MGQSHYTAQDHKHLKGAKWPVSEVNDYWTGSVYFESLYGPEYDVTMDLVFDTTSDWTYAVTVDCVYDCGTPEKYFRADGNVAFAEKNVNGFDVTYITNWIAKVAIGNFWVTDDAFGLGLITGTKDYIPAEVGGWLGLARSQPFKTGAMAGATDYARGDSFVEAMVDMGRFNSSTFSFFLSSNDAEDGERYVDFGLPVGTSMSNPDKIKYIELQDDLFWASLVQGFAFGSLKNGYRVPRKEHVNKNGEMYTIFDSTSATIQLPHEVFEEYIVQLMTDEDDKVLEHEVYSSTSLGVTTAGVVAACDFDYPDLHFLFGTTWLTVAKDDYVMPAGDLGSSSDCFLLLSNAGKEVPYAHMGLPLYKGYYSVHDDLNGRMGFVPHKGSSKKGPFESTGRPTEDMNMNKKTKTPDADSGDCAEWDADCLQVADLEGRLNGLN